MQLELVDDKGLIGTIELPLEQIKEALGLGSASVADPAAVAARKVEVESFEAQLKEKGEEIAKLEARAIDDYSPEEKANFVIKWASGLSVEEKAVFAEAVELPIAIATDAEVAEAEAKGEVEPPKTIKGRTTRPGYKFLEYLNLSVKED